MATEKYPKSEQSPARLGDAAGAAQLKTEGTARAEVVLDAKPGLADRAKSLAASRPPADAKPSCQQTLWLTFFFDGTGNNLEADVGTEEHSNVARLFNAHKLNSDAEGRYAFYIPGIGTYFKDIGDPGGTTLGRGFGGDGQKRLDWAFQRFDERIKFAEARAANPTNKICMINVAVFGFSRGATLARAFARDLARRCEAAGDGWRLSTGRHPIRLYFLGLFDTVASVGAPMSSNSPPARGLGLGVLSLRQAMKNRSGFDAALGRIAFGAPGADPAPGTFDGHGSWADGLRIPRLVERCVHMVAAHEIRNSFPVDSLLDDNAYPQGCSEMVYPGAHSDVGGGYRLGEGARSQKHGSMLSLIPLRAMLRQAKDAGVPLVGFAERRSDSEKRDFALDDGGQPEYAKLAQRFNHYMSVAGWGGRPVGQMVLSHMRLYYGWRFHQIRRNLASRAKSEPTRDEAVLQQQQPGWTEERKRLERELQPLKTRLEDAERRRARADAAYENARLAQVRFGVPVDPAIQSAAEVARNDANAAKDAYLKAKARFDTLPGNVRDQSQNLEIYDQQLLADARELQALVGARERANLRPHYRGLLEAYEAEFDQGAGLRDEQILAFFDEYVHDSLAGFAQDATLPSDPRVIYIGGDTKLRYAGLQPHGERESAAA